MIKRTIVALCLGTSLGACDNIPTCSNDMVTAAIKSIFYEKEMKRLNTMGKEDIPIERLRDDPFGSMILANQNERRELRKVKGADMQLSDVRQIDSQSGSRSCQASIVSLPGRTSQLKIVWTIYREKGSDPEIGDVRYWR